MIQFTSRKIKLISCLLTIFLSWCSFANAGSYEEVKIFLPEDNTTYTVPAYYVDENAFVSSVVIEDFYVKNEAGTELIVLNMDFKATLYGASLMAANLKRRQYWEIRKHAENVYFAVGEEIGEVRAFKPGGSIAAIGIAAGGGCVYGGWAGAAAGTVVPGAGNLAGFGAGCLTGALVGGSAALLDEMGAYAVDYFRTYSDASREEIVIAETQDMLGDIYEYSSKLEVLTISWLNNKNPVTISDLAEAYDNDILLKMWADILKEYAKTMYPQSVVIYDAAQEYMQMQFGWGVNALQIAASTTDVAGWWGGVPASTIMKFVQFEAEMTSFAGQSAQELSQETLQRIEKELLFTNEERDNLRKGSPLSSENRNINKAIFEDREPVEFSGAYLTGVTSIFNPGEQATVKAVIQKMGQIYSTAAISYEVTDSRGNVTQTGGVVFDGAEYLANFQVSNNPGKYSVLVSAVDNENNAFGQTTLNFLVNNPTEGHDLSINSFSSSRNTAEPGEHTVYVDIGVMNNGLYSENVTVNLAVQGPNGYSWTSSTVALGSLASGFTQTYDNPLSWSVPSTAVDGSYSLLISVIGEEGDYTPTNNSASVFVYVGDYKRVIPTAMIGKEMELAWDQNLNLSGIIDGCYSDYGGYGWVSYTSQGNTYQIAICGVWDGGGDRVGGEGAIAVKKNNALVYASSRVNEDVGEPIYVPGTPLIVYIWSLNDQYDAGLVISEEYSGIGFDVRERTTIPNLKTEYNTMFDNLSCTNFHTHIHEATVNSSAEWNFNIAWVTDDDITYELSECSTTSRKIFLASPSIKKHNFVVEHRTTTQPSGYNPAISGADSLSSYTYYWLTGVLDVQNYNDIAIAEESLPSELTSGDTITFTVNVVKEGTIAPTDIDVFWSITGPNEYKKIDNFSGTIGSNELIWDTNGLDAGQYSLAVECLSVGDYDTDDIKLIKNITLNPAPPTQVIPPAVVTAANSLISLQSNVATSGENFPITVELKNASGECLQEGFAYARQRDVSGDFVFTSLLLKDTNSCLFSGNPPLMPTTTSIVVMGHLTRHDNGFLEIPIDVTTLCDPQLLVLSKDIAADGGAGSIDLSVQAGCQWTASANNDWLHVVGDDTGDQSWAIHYSVDANTTTLARTGSVTVAGKTFTVSQAGQTLICNYTISPLSQSFSTDGGAGTITVTTSPGCDWIAMEGSSWLSLTSGSSGSGSGSVQFAVVQNSTDVSRNAIITVAGINFEVSQSAPQGCNYTISPLSQSFTTDGGAGTITVTTSPGCDWIAMEGSSWLSLTSGSSGSGSGSVQFAVVQNSTDVSRNATITVAGINFEVSQSAPQGCNYTISPLSQSFTTDGGAGTITVTTSPGCDWIAMEGSSWLSLTSGSSGSGSGSVQFAVAQNSTDVSRNAIITVAGKQIKISQSSSTPKSMPWLSLLLAKSQPGSGDIPDERELFASVVSVAPCELKELGSFVVPSGESWVTINVSSTAGDLILLIDDDELPSREVIPPYVCENGYAESFNADWQIDFYNNTTSETWNLGWQTGDELRVSVFSYGGISNHAVVIDSVLTATSN